MRVAQVFNRALAVEGARVCSVAWVAGRFEVQVRLAAVHRRRPCCGGCGRRVGVVHDHRVRRLRHLDVGVARVVVVCRVARVRCPRCGVRSQSLPFARPRARFTRAFEDTVAWLCQRAPISTVAALMRVDWASVGRIARRVITERLADSDGLDGLQRIGVDEVAIGAGQRYLTVVCCHDTARVVWVGAGPRPAALERFFDQLAERAAHLVCVSADLGQAYPPVISRRAPQAAICADPFHLVAQAGFALDRLRSAEWRRLRAEDPQAGRWLKGTRFALRRGPAQRSDADRDLLGRLAHQNRAVFTAHLWCDQLRAALTEREPARLANLIPDLAEAADNLGHRRFRALATTLRRHTDRIQNLARHGITNGRLEGLNSTVRLISHRSRGFRRIDNLISLIHLICGRLEITLPHTNP